MKKFVWRLQRVLDIKEKTEQNKRLELLRLTEKLAMTQGQLMAARRILNKMIDGLTAKKGMRRLNEQEFFMKYSDTINERIDRLKKKAIELEQQQREKIAELLKIRRFKKALEKLRAKAKRGFLEEVEKLEQKQSDERAIISFTRKMAKFAKNMP